MDLKDVLDGMVEQKRSAIMNESEQLTLGELTLLFDHVEQQDLPVVFDDGEYRPKSLGSWRGSYRELAVRYEAVESSDEETTAEEFLSMLKSADGDSFMGYKGGQYKMGSTTPVWVANYGSSTGFEHGNQGVVDVEENDEQVVIVTDSVEYV